MTGTKPQNEKNNTNSTMKLLIISDAWHPQVNGVVRTYEYLRDELIKRGHSVTVVGPSDFSGSMPMIGYSEIRLTFAPYFRLRRVNKRHAPDNIHIATEGPLGWAARLYCKRNEIKFTTSYHTHFPDYVAKRVSRFLPFLYTPVRGACKKTVKQFHRLSSAVMVATQSLEDDLKDWGFRAPMHRLTRGANLDLFYPALEEKPANENKRPIALYVGRVAIEKNLEDFLEMEWDGSKIIVGHGPSFDILKNKYPDATFTGPKQGKELAEIYRSSDVFVFPSKTDTFGIVIIEALASGLPVAGYNVTGPKDIITDPLLGHIHNSDLKIAADLCVQNDSPELRQKRADHVKNTYTWEKAAEQFEQAQMSVKN
jgi:glycosyltransferase involved in cell wall biosynthesis